MLSRGMIKIVICSGAFGEKIPNKYSKKFFLNFQICHNQFLYFETVVCPIFAKPVLDIFAVFPLAPRINLPHTGLFIPKKSKLLTTEGWFSIFLSYGLKTTMKITMFSTCYVMDNFSCCYSWNSCQKIQTLSIKLFSKQKWNLLVWRKSYGSYRFYHGESSPEDLEDLSNSC